MRAARAVTLFGLLAFPAFAAAQTGLGGAIEVGAIGFYSHQIAMAPSGDFVVAWTRLGGSLPAGAFGRIYKATGAARTSEFRLNAKVQDFPDSVRLAMMNDGSFVAVFFSHGFVLARRFSSRGQPLSGNLTLVRADLIWINVGSRGDGSFVLSWYGSSGSLVRVFGADGKPLGPEASLDSYAVDTPRLAVGRDGSFLVVWQAGLRDGNYGVQGQIFDRSGVARGASFAISDPWPPANGGTEGYDATVGDDGNFIVTWGFPNGATGGREAFVRRFALDGSPLAEPSSLGASQAGRVLAAGPGGSFVSVWPADSPNSSRLDVVAGQFGADDEPLGSR